LDGPVSTSTKLPLLDETLVATQRYLHALTGLDDESAGQPSVLPGWSRAHVVAHVSRNADAFTRVLRSAAAGEAASMYDTQDAREHDIGRTVEENDVAGLLRDADASARRLEQAWRVYDGPEDATYARLPTDDAAFVIGTIGPRRRAEVEIHHTDLDIGYPATYWPPDFSAAMVKQRQEELAAAGPDGGVSMVL
jgi:maleylpyruvate isomerase